MRKFDLLTCFLLFVLIGGAGNSHAKDNTRISKVDLVDMFMGVQGMSNCVIGPQLPHGSVNPAPQTATIYHNGYDQHAPIRGFGQLHVSGIGWGRYGQIFVSPQVGFNAKETGHDSPKSGEVATPYYYKVNLDRYGICTEITSTHHCSAYRFTFPKTKNANILLDVMHNIPQHILPIIGGRFLGGEIKIDETGLLTGWGEYKGGFGSADPYKVFFAIWLDTPMKVKIVNKGTKALYARLSFPEMTSTVHMNIGVSMKNIANAREFLANETEQNDFNTIKDLAKQNWEDVFSLIDVRGGSEEEQRLFYTAMYHSFVMPRDRTGDNSRWETTMPHMDDHYCVWDTWRTTYPLMTLLNESFVAKTINSFIDRFAHDSICTPTFTSGLNWDWKQGGDDVDNIIADAFAKNLKGFDREKAYQLVKWNASHARDSLYLNYGWVPETGARMSCSYTMEYAYNDYCGAQVAKTMGDYKEADRLTERSGRWTNLFNPGLESHGFNGFVGPRGKDGQWQNIDPAKRQGPWVKYFYEGNSWVYSLFAPHQFDRLVELCGGKEQMIKILTYGFENDLIEMDNEPGFLAPFIFSHCDRPDLAAKAVTDIRRKHFSLKTGYPENEDSGAMGAWYIFTSMGFFPNAGQNIYYLLPPAFQEISLTMENGKKIDVKTVKSSPEACYIESVTLNGRVLDRSWIYHAEIVDGATLVYKLTEKENAWKVGVEKQKKQPFGVNLAGAEFFHKKMEGVGRFNEDYFYPTLEELDYWNSKGLKLIRLPFKWERIQRNLYGELNREEIDYIKYLLKEADERGMQILIDMHNYGRRKDQGKDRIIGDSLVIEHLAYAWGLIAKELNESKGLYGYGLMNEPHDMLASTPWVKIAQEAIEEIRKYDQVNAIVVGGNHWSSAAQWAQVSDELKYLQDPCRNLIFEAHCYFDRDGSGIYRGSYDEEKAYPTIGVERVAPFVKWLKENNQRGLLGEFGIPGNDERWLVCLDNFLSYLSVHGVNAIYWAAGARWNKYILSVHPDDNYTKDKPQMKILTKYLGTED